jgi:diaminopimelate decarboxylase
MQENRSQQLIKEVLKKNVLEENDSSYIIYDLELVEQRFNELKDAFPEDTLHGIAIKACPLPAMLRKQAAAGLGAEAASIEEVQIAIKSGIPTDRIIFDGPAKTHAEIQFCIENQIYINIDSFEELDRVAKIRGDNKTFVAGMRLNPQLGLGKIGDTSVAGKKSKFGINLDDYSERIQEAFKDNSWLVGVHVHIGSQGMSLDELVLGAKMIYEFSQTLDGLERFDLGGGLPVVYSEKDSSVNLKDYTDALKKEVSGLFSGKLKLLTEFGRSIYSDTAIAVSNIEYVKNDNQIVAHLGADMFLRRVYKPQEWFHQLSVFDPTAKIITRPEQSYTVAGPLCFGGDFLSREVVLPKVSEHDMLIIHDVGAYTLSMWSRHCSRFTPKVLGVGNELVEICKKRETIEQLMNFWGGD